MHKARSSSPKPPQSGDLLNAASDDDLDEVKYLLRQGADVNETDAYGNTPLSRAASRGHLEVMRVLIENGANINSRNKLGSTPLMMALFSPYSPARALIIRMLLDKGAEIALRNNEGKTALDIAIGLARLDAVRILKDESVKRQRLAEEFAQASAAKRREELAEKKRRLNELAKKSPKPVIVPKAPKA